MSHNIIGNLRPVRDFALESDKRIVWNDAIDEKNHYHFTVNTKQRFFEGLEQKLGDGYNCVVFIDGKSNNPYVVIDKDELTQEDFELATQAYRRWLKEWDKK